MQPIKETKESAPNASEAPFKVQSVNILLDFGTPDANFDSADDFPSTQLSKEDS